MAAISFKRDPSLSLRSLLSDQEGFRVALLDRASSPQKCLENFFKSISSLAVGQGLTFHATEMPGVGLRIDGRASCFDLWWLRREPHIIYAVDVRDDEYVCSCPLTTTVIVGRRS
jgi:hypothetical protein